MKNIFFRLFKSIVKNLRGTGLGSLPFAMTIYRGVVRFVSPEKVKIGNNLLFVDKGDSESYSLLDVYGELQTDLIKRIIKRGWNIVDVGAHVGYFTLLFAEKVSNRGRVYAFEPDPDNFKILRKNILVNNYRNVVLVKKAVSEASGKVFFLTAGRTSATRKISDQRLPGKTIIVPSISLDDYFKDKKIKIDFIKIDVEGAEYKVLKGMMELLKNNGRLLLLIEFCPSMLEMSGVAAGELLSFLSGLGYKFHDIDEKTRLVKSTPKELLRRYSGGGITNILCSRGEEFYESWYS